MSSLPTDMATKLNFTSISAEINNFKNVSLLDVLAVHSSTKFLPNSTKYCYEMRYKHLEFLFRESHDNHPTYLSQKFKDSYVMQTMHSLSGEQSDLCFYTYSPIDLLKFLENNKQNHYTFLPVTVHATESANGYRHDMMLIFDNKTMLFYCFDCGNRTDYLYFGREIPKGALDVLFINLSDRVKTGYTYEPMALWMIQDVCQPSAFSNQLDFVMSTVWCYIVASTLDKYDSPTEMLSILDTLSKEDLFHLLYSSMLNLIGAKYHPTVNKNVQVNLYDPIAPHPLDNIMSVHFSAIPPGVIMAGVLAANGQNGNQNANVKVDTNGNTSQNANLNANVKVDPNANQNANVKDNWDDSESDSDSDNDTNVNANTANLDFAESVAIAKAIELSKQEELARAALLPKKEELPTSHLPVDPFNPLIQPFIDFPDLNKKEEPYNFQRVTSSISEVTSEGASETTPLLNSSFVNESNVEKHVEPLSPLLKRDDDEHCNPM